MKPVIAVAVCLSVCLALAAPAAAQPNPLNPYILSIAYGGSGCPQGSVGSSFANDRLSFTLIFDQFIAVNAPGTPAAAKRANCDVLINLHIPPGSGDVCFAADHRGYVQLPAGGRGNADAKYDFHSQGYGRTRVGKGSDAFVGPRAADYLRRDQSTVTWSTAASSMETLSIGATLALTGAGTSQMTTDSIDGEIRLGACQPEPEEP
jgi:hypothetical protein